MISNDLGPGFQVRQQDIEKAGPVCWQPRPTSDIGTSVVHECQQAQALVGLCAEALACGWITEIGAKLRIRHLRYS